MLYLYLGIWQLSICTIERKNRGEGVGLSGIQFKLVLSVEGIRLQSKCLVIGELIYYTNIFFLPPPPSSLFLIHHLNHFL